MAKTFDAKVYVKDMIANNKVLIFSDSKNYFCDSAKREAMTLNVPVEIVEIDLHPEGEAIRNVIKKRTKQDHLPNIFVAGKHIGDSDKFSDAKFDGKIAKLLKTDGGASGAGKPKPKFMAHFRAWLTSF